jgi:sucrose-phosphate synthase
MDKIITAGNSGNDLDMLKGKANGIVVSNYSAELEELKKVKSVFFSRMPLAKGVLDGIQHYVSTQKLLD